MIRSISAAPEGGNIKVLGIHKNEAQLAINPDAIGGWLQWFNFIVDAEPGSDTILNIVNAGQCSYPDGWAGYRAFVRDLRGWYRIPTEYSDGTLVLRHHVGGYPVQMAYFEPYPLSRLSEQLKKLPATWSFSTIGRSFEGRPIDSIRVGEGPFTIWIIGRQHSGETMASWWIEGALQRLRDRPEIGQQATFYIVPLANPDGTHRGYLRGNAAGLDLNRQWAAPSWDRAPEVGAILAEMERSGVDLVLDVHGDECIPHVFIDGCERIPDVSPWQLAGLAAFNRALAARSSVFQTRVGYPTAYAGDAAGGMCARAVASRFGAIGMTLEMPFTRSAEIFDPVQDWSSSASQELGGACIDALADLVKSEELMRQWRLLTP